MNIKIGLFYRYFMFLSVLMRMSDRENTLSAYSILSNIYPEVIIFIYKDNRSLKRKYF